MSIRSRIASFLGRFGAPSPKSPPTADVLSSSGEQRLADLELRFRLAIDGANDGIWDWNMETQTVWVSRRWLEICGLAPESERKYCFVDWQKRIHPEDQKEFLESMKEYLYGNAAFFRSEHRIEVLDGTYRWVYAKGTVERNAGGKPVRMAGSVTDIHARKQAIAALKASEAKAKSSDLAKSKFLAMVSHEIRTPLNGMMGIIDILSKKTTNAEDQQWLTLLSRSTDSLTTLLSEVIAFTRADQETEPHTRNHWNVVALLKNQIDLLAPAAEGKGLRLMLNSRLSPRLLASVDKARLEQVLANLISNAIKFTDAGEIILTAAFLPHDDGEMGLEIQVTDSGIGISCADTDNIFSPFFRGSNAQERFGSGLGLSICKKLTNLMGGTLRYKRNEPQGSCFTLLIPVRDAYEENIPQVEMRQEIVTKQIQGKGIPILVVEDNEINQVVMMQHLTDLGYEPTLADCAAKAFQAMDQRKFSAVLLDCQLPDQDGVTVAQSIRASGSNQSTPIIGVSAQSFPDDIARCLQSGMNDFLSKPFRSVQLQETLSRWISMDSTES